MWIRRCKITEFVKTESAGNDFVLFDRTSSGRKPVRWKNLVPAICSRRRGVGADGVLVLEKEKAMNFRMRIFNPDGSEVEMCGNGARCCALYYFKKTGKNKLKFQTGAGAMQAEQGRGASIRLLMPNPAGMHLDMVVNLGDTEISGSFINTGVPHFVVETDSVDSIDVIDIGRKIRHNSEFAPGGTNANFVSITGKSSLRVRTYERGVEDETLACGTGVVASAVVQALRKKVTPPVTVLTEGGSFMKVYFGTGEDADLISRVYNVKLEGKAREVFRGTLKLSKIKTSS